MFFFFDMHQALAKTLSEDDLFYLRAQFAHLKANRNGQISLENFKSVSENETSKPKIDANKLMKKPLENQ